MRISFLSAINYSQEYFQADVNKMEHSAQNNTCTKRNELTGEQSH